MERKRKGRESEGRRRTVKSCHQFSLIIKKKKKKWIEVTPDNTVVQAWALQPDCLNLSHDLTTY